MLDVDKREKKARTIIAVISDFVDKPLREMTLLDIGASTGIMDNYLAGSLGKVTGTDIDEAAIRIAKERHKKTNLRFMVADALDLPFPDESFDIVICSQVYEHVPDSDKLLEEIFRVLKHDGICYFAANNRLMLIEPHHGLPLLSVIPKPWAHIYMRLSGRGKIYYENHLTYWGLKSLTKKFKVIDYTDKVVSEPKKYFADYMIRPNSFKWFFARTMLKFFYWGSPAYIWLLQKP
jgi:ubiquinone/menaquinone biosynthesis C-methylase UbiE